MDRQKNAYEKLKGKWFYTKLLDNYKSAKSWSISLDIQYAVKLTENKEKTARLEYNPLLVII